MTDESFVPIVLLAALLLIFDIYGTVAGLIATAVCVVLPLLWIMYETHKLRS